VQPVAVSDRVAAGALRHLNLAGGIRLPPADLLMAPTRHRPASQRLVTAYICATKCNEDSGVIWNLNLGLIELVGRCIPWAGRIRCPIDRGRANGCRRRASIDLVLRVTNTPLTHLHVPHVGRLNLIASRSPKWVAKPSKQRTAVASAPTIQRH
jgi:hypothetical protein